MDNERQDAAWKLFEDAHWSDDHTCNKCDSHAIYTLTEARQLMNRIANADPLVFVSILMPKGEEVSNVN